MQVLKLFADTMHGGQARNVASCEEIESRLQDSLVSVKMEMTPWVVEIGPQDLVGDEVIRSEITVRTYAVGSGGETAPPKEAALHAALREKSVGVGSAPGGRRR